MEAIKPWKIIFILISIRQTFTVRDFMWACILENKVNFDGGLSSKVWSALFEFYLRASSLIHSQLFFRWQSHCLSFYMSCSEIKIDLKKISQQNCCKNSVKILKPQIIPNSSFIWHFFFLITIKTKRNFI